MVCVCVCVYSEKSISDLFLKCGNRINEKVRTYIHVGKKAHTHTKRRVAAAAVAAVAAVATVAERVYA